MRFILFTLIFCSQCVWAIADTANTGPVKKSAAIGAQPTKKLTDYLTLFFPNSGRTTKATKKKRDRPAIETPHSDATIARMPMEQVQRSSNLSAKSKALRNSRKLMISIIVK